MIKAAQERENLQRKGDDLDAKIKKAEKEVRQLEKTLGKLNDKNNEFRTSFRKLSDKEAASEQEGLQRKLDATYDTLKHKEEEQRQLQLDLEQQESALSNMHSEERSVQQQIEELQAKEETLQTDYKEQKSRFQQAQAQLESDLRSLRESKGVSPEDHVEEEDLLEAIEGQETEREVLSELRTLASHEPALASKLSEFGVELE